MPACFIALEKLSPDVLGRQAEAPKIIAVDLQPIGPVEGVHAIQGDITSEATVVEIVKAFAGEKADLIVCDGAPDGRYCLFIGPSGHMNSSVSDTQ